MYIMIIYIYIVILDTCILLSSTLLTASIQLTSVAACIYTCMVLTISGAPHARLKAS